MMGYLEYRTNNSGGNWWLQDSHWLVLDRAGWVVHWNHDVNDNSHEHAKPPYKGFGGHHHGYSDSLLPATSDGTRWMEALATSAAKEVNSAKEAEEAVLEFESVTGQSVDDTGCGCCGPPHSFAYYDDNGDVRYFDSSPSGYDRSWS